MPMGDSVLPLSIVNQANNGVDEMNQQFEVGQRVKIVNLPDTLSEYSAERGAGKTGVVTEINLGDPDGITCLVTLDGERKYTSSFWFKPQHLELIDDPTPQPAAIQYPPLRNMVDGKPLKSWQDVLRYHPLAERQPHLYIKGYYEFVTASSVEMISFLNERPHTLIFDFNPPLDADNESDFGTYRVFVITEEA